MMLYLLFLECEMNEIKRKRGWNLHIFFKRWYCTAARRYNLTQNRAFRQIPELKRRDLFCRRRRLDIFWRQKNLRNLIEASAIKRPLNWPKHLQRSFKAITPRAKMYQIENDTFLPFTAISFHLSFRYFRSFAVIGIRTHDLEPRSNTNFRLHWNKALWLVINFRLHWNKALWFVINGHGLWTNKS